MSRHAWVAAAALWTAACGGTSLPGLSSSPDDAEAVTLVSDCESGDPITLLGISQTEREVLLEVRHSGGCEPHTYVACLEDPHPDEPPVWNLTIFHNDHDDVCEALQMRVLRIRLDRDLTATAFDASSVRFE